MCIDGAPAYLKKLLLKSIDSDEFSEQLYEKTIIMSIAKTYLPSTDVDELAAKLQNLIDWQAKLDALIEFLTAFKCEVDSTFLRNFTTGLYHRALSTFVYPTINAMKIRSDITLVRATETTVTDIDEFYELQRQTEGKVNLKYIEGNHQTVLENSALVNFINQFVLGAK